MSYTVRHKQDGTWELVNGEGDVISEDNPNPCNRPDDIIDSILADMGLGDPQREALKVILTKDWDVVYE